MEVELRFRAFDNWKILILTLQDLLDPGPEQIKIHVIPRTKITLYRKGDVPHTSGSYLRVGEVELNLVVNLDVTLNLIRKFLHQCSELGLIRIEADRVHGSL